MTADFESLILKISEATQSSVSIKYNSLSSKKWQASCGMVIEYGDTGKEAIQNLINQIVSDLESEQSNHTSLAWALTDIISKLDAVSKDISV